MTARSILESRQGELTGGVLTSPEREHLQHRVPSLASEFGWLLDLMSEFRISGTTFELDEDDDASGFGVELKWMNAEEMADEAINAYPGKAIQSMGYLPVGICLMGSGDPYFLQPQTDGDPTLVRVPHDAVVDEQVQASSIEVVSESLGAFLEAARIEAG